MKGILHTIAFDDKNGIEVTKGPGIKGIDRKSLKARIQSGEIEVVEIPLIGEELER